MTIKIKIKMIIIMLLAVSTIGVQAHVLKENSARITLRDGQVEVRMLVDVKRWENRLQSNESWLLGDIGQVMPKDLSIKRAETFMAKVLVSESSLTLNNKALELSIFTITAKSNSQHPEFTEFVLTSQHTSAIVEQINIRFPKSVGAVHASFVKPKYQLVAAGEHATVSF